MKNKLFLLALGTMFLTACASSQQRSKEKMDMDSTKTKLPDTNVVDTVKRDTSRTTEQKPIQHPGL
ncbi:hypothetical protein OQX61_24030 [Pedobacter sp. PLR]|uniref:hypothetical protein n=1 Tax=Pedobacter sp. PLR TaxID=2994465 RepID=UPI002245188A|nr:hypothetical protein [Pedobacter sp. PLR]MCX2454360.1 hypothetical protein [Pedobacter sp. PLR]